MKKVLCKYTIFEVLTIVCLFANIIHTHQEIMDLDRFYHILYPFSHIFFFLFEGISIYFLSLFIYPKKRHIVFISLYTLSTIILWINVAYSRYFDTYMPLTLYGEFNNLKGLLPNIIDSFEWSDIYYVITSFFALFFYFKFGKLQKPKLGYIIPLLCTALLLASFSYHLYSVKKDHDHLVEHFKELNDKRTIWDTMVDRRRMMENTIPKTSEYYYGIGLTLFLNGMNSLMKTDQYHFTEQEVKDIKHHMYASEYPLPNDSIQNLIMILVESLSSFPINKSYNGIELTPNLNKLIAEAYYNPNMESEALLGESSDGQFIYLTGLLPLKNGVTINAISAKQITTFVSLLKERLPELQSHMTIPTEKDNWSQEAMCRKYGIDTLYSKEQYPLKIDEDWLNDRQLFDYATQNDSKLRPPFISFVLTSSMHSPYIKSYENYNIIYPKEYSSDLKHYLDNVHYMDKYLGQYLEAIKQQPWYNDCTIIITADHKPNGPKLNVADESSFTAIPLIIVHPGERLKDKKTKYPIAQTSVFPTILDLYHIRVRNRGVGISITAPDSIRMSDYETERLKRKEFISTYIINKNYLQ